MAEQKNNVYKKLQAARVAIQEKAIKKSGENKYSNYSYLELSDFLPFINEECDKVGLCPIFQFTREEAKLIIHDAEEDTAPIIFTTPVEITPLKGCNGMQAIGGAETYCRRYLYCMAFEIAENDLLNQAEEDEQKEADMQKITPVKVALIEQKIRETGTDKEKFLKWIGVKKIDDITVENFGKCMKAFEDKAKKNAELKKTLLIK